MIFLSTNKIDKIPSEADDNSEGKYNLNCKIRKYFNSYSKKCHKYMVEIRAIVGK